MFSSAGDTKSIDSSRDVLQFSLIFPPHVIDVPIAGDTKSIDYSRDVSQISVISQSQVIDIPVVGDTNSIDYGRDVLQISRICPSQVIDVPRPHVPASANMWPRMPFLGEIWQRMASSILPNLWQDQIPLSRV